MLGLNGLPTLTCKKYVETWSDKGKRWHGIHLKITNYLSLLLLFTHSMTFFPAWPCSLHWMFLDVGEQFFFFLFPVSPPTSKILSTQQQSSSQISLQPCTSTSMCFLVRKQFTRTVWCHLVYIWTTWFHWQSTELVCENSKKKRKKKHKKLSVLSVETAVSCVQIFLVCFTVSCMVFLTLSFASTIITELSVTWI